MGISSRHAANPANASQSTDLNTAKTLLSHSFATDLFYKLNSKRLLNLKSFQVFTLIDINKIKEKLNDKLS